VTGFDTIVVADWSARSTPSPARPSKDAIFLGICRDRYVATLYQRTRSQAMRNIRGLIDGDLRAGRRILLAFDFPSPIRAALARALPVMAIR
jgi:molybdopterin molybdotransferase